MARRIIGGALTEYIEAVSADYRDALSAKFDDLDLTELDDIAEAHGFILTALVSGKISPEFAAEAREMLSSATTLAAARAQNVFLTATAVDGAQALHQSVLEAQQRRKVEDADTAESRGEADDIEDV